MMGRLGLTLNEAKTSVREARQESFDFLGYSFGPHWFRKDGHWYLGASPSKRSVSRLKAKVRGVLGPGNHAPWPEVRDQLNSMLRGWSHYFDHGTRMPAYRAVNNAVYEAVRTHPARTTDGLVYFWSRSSRSGCDDVMDLSLCGVAFLWESSPASKPQ